MDNTYIYSVLKEVLGKDFIEEISDELRYIDKYFIDIDRKKYIVICKIFDSVQELYDKWEFYQDEDIALKLQNYIYKNDDIRWDMYYILIYKGDQQIDDMKGFEIERDRFCCKKLIINAQSEVLFRRDLNYKLPIAGVYSKFTNDVDVANDELFFKLVNEKTNLDVKEIMDKLNNNNN
ncbi:hypothetical protein SH2C18_31140 [Clostridium sediminicola]|uniref:ABC-three component system middle component 1 n=1 Tax=Clostridium sediminicola TaxID=3114879 RepID=UPI0031F2759B